MAKKKVAKKAPSKKVVEEEIDIFAEEEASDVKVSEVSQESERESLEAQVVADVVGESIEDPNEDFATVDLAAIEAAEDPNEDFATVDLAAIEAAEKAKAKRLVGHHP